MTLPSAELQSLHQLVGERRLDDAQSLLYELALRRNNPLYHFFDYFHIVERNTTAEISFSKRSIFLGARFFQQHIISMDDLDFVLGHERDHYVLASLFGRDHLQQFPHVGTDLNFIEDGFINYHQFTLNPSQLAIRFYKNPNKFLFLQSLVHRFSDWAHSLEDIPEHSVRAIVRVMTDLYAGKLIYPNYVEAVDRSQFFYHLEEMQQDDGAEGDQPSTDADRSPSQPSSQPKSGKSITELSDKEESEEEDHPEDQEGHRSEEESHNSQGQDSEESEESEEDDSDGDTEEEETEVEDADGSGDSENNPESDDNAVDCAVVHLDAVAGKGQHWKTPIPEGELIKVFVQTYDDPVLLSLLNSYERESDIPVPAPVGWKELRWFISSQQHRSVLSSVIGDTVTRSALENRCVMSPFMPVPPSREDVFMIGAGFPPLEYTHPIPDKSSSEREEFGLYIDTSGSVASFWPCAARLAREARESITHLYYFSDEVVSIDEEELIGSDPFILTSGGTQFNKVARHIVDNRVQRVAIMTDEDDNGVPINPELLRQVHDTVTLLLILRVPGSHDRHIWGDKATYIPIYPEHT